MALASHHSEASMTTSVVSRKAFYAMDGSDVYDVGDWSEYHSGAAKRTVKNLDGGMYYATMGGGPEGGYVVKNDRVYWVERSWWRTWSVSQQYGKRLRIIKVAETQWEPEQFKVKLVKC